MVACRPLLVQYKNTLKKDALRLVDSFHTFRHAAFRDCRKYCYLHLNALLQINKI